MGEKRVNLNKCRKKDVTYKERNPKHTLGQRAFVSLSGGVADPFPRQRSLFHAREH